MTVGDHFVVKLFGDLISQEFLNVFTYRQTAGSAPLPADDLGSMIDTSIVARLANCIGTYVGLNRIETFGIENPSDYDDRAPTDINGNRSFATENVPPSYTAFGYRSNRAGAGTRSSYKRFCGLGETDVTGNTLAASFLVLEAAAGLQDILSSALIHASGNVFQPVQLRSGWVLGTPPIENFTILAYGVPYLTSQVSRRA